MSALSKQFLKLGVLSLVSYPLGFMIQLLMSYYFGTSAKVDAYWLVMTMINFCGFFVLPVREAIASGYHLRRINGKDGGNLYFSSAINLLVLVLLAVSAFLYCCPEFFAQWLIPPGKGVLLDDVIRLFHVAIPLVMLVSITDIFNGFLVSSGRIFFQDFGRILGSCFAILFLWLLAGKMGVTSIIAAAVVSSIFMITVQSFALRNTAFRYHLFSLPRIDLASLRMSGALVLVYFFSQLYIFYERAVFIGFREGALAAFQYALALNNVCAAICIGNICNVIWPRIVHLLGSGDVGGIGELLTASMRNILVLIVFLGMFCWCYTETIVYLVFFRGKFDAVSLQQTSGFFRAVLLSLPFLAISGIIGRLLVSRQLTRYLFGIGAGSALGGVSTLAFAQATGSLTAAGYHTAVSACCGAAFSAYAGWRQNALNWRGDACKWGCKLLSLAALTLFLFLCLPLGVTGGKLELLAHLTFRFSSVALLFASAAFRFDLFKLAGDFNLFSARRSRPCL